LKTLKNYDLKSFDCQKIIKIFFDNYKCIKCKIFE